MTYHEIYRKKLILLIEYILPTTYFLKLKNFKQAFLHESWKLRWKLRTRFFHKNYHLDPYVKDGWYLINPKKIIFYSKEFDFYKADNAIVDGNWDIHTINRLDEYDFYKSFLEVKHNNTTWKQTKYYQRVASQISQGKLKWGCRTLTEFDARLAKLDAIYENIRKNGYQQMEKEEGITVNIGRHGDLFLNGGKHRMTFCKILHIQKVPVRITVRHPKWVQFKNEIFDYAAKHNNKIYAPLTHIDLRLISSHYGPERYHLISANLDIRQGSLLDIGSHWGYFCHKFEEKGFHCYALENDITNLYFLRKLKRAENRSFTIIPESAFAFGKSQKEYDVVLALGIFHHFIKNENTHHKLTKLLQNLKIKTMFFLPHLPQEDQMHGAFRNYSPLEFVQFIIKHSCLETAKMIGYAEDERPIYKLSV